MEIKFPQKDKDFLEALKALLACQSSDQGLMLAERLFRYEDHEIDLDLARCYRDEVFGKRERVIHYALKLESPNIDPKFFCQVECFGFDEIYQHICTFALSLARFLGISEFPKEEEPQEEMVAEEEPQPEPKKKTSYFNFRTHEGLRAFCEERREPFKVSDIAEVTGRSVKTSRAWIQRQVKSGTVQLHKEGKKGPGGEHLFVFVRNDNECSTTS